MDLYLFWKQSERKREREIYKIHYSLTLELRSGLRLTESDPRKAPCVTNHIWKDHVNIINTTVPQLRLLLRSSG